MASLFAVGKNALGEPLTSFLARKCTLPSPRIYGYQLSSTESDNGREYLILEKLSGIPWSTLDFSPAIEERLISEMGEYLRELRNYRDQGLGSVRLNGRNTLEGGAIAELANLAPAETVYSLHEYAEVFLRTYANAILAKFAGNRSIVQPFCGQWSRIERLLDHNIDLLTPNDCGPFVLTHQDLVKKNILIHEGKVSGVVDWEWTSFASREMEGLAGLDFISTERHKSVLREAVGEDLFAIDEGRRLIYKLISCMYRLLTCDEWGAPKIRITARFMTDKQLQRDGPQKPIDVLPILEFTLNKIYRYIS